MSHNQAMACAVLTELGFQHIPGPSGIMGGPSQWKATDATLEHIKQLLNKTITVESDGKIHVQ